MSVHKKNCMSVHKIFFMCVGQKKFEIWIFFASTATSDCDGSCDKNKIWNITFVWEFQKELCVII